MSSEEINDDYDNADPNDQLAYWYPITHEENTYIATAPTASVVLDQPKIPQTWKEAYLASGYDLFREGNLRR